MASPQRILVLGTATGGGDWPPLAAVTVGLHQAGHAVQCFGDPAIAQDSPRLAIAVEVVPAGGHLRRFLCAVACCRGFRACAVAGMGGRLLASGPVHRARFQAPIVLSQLFTVELARLVKAACGLPWCCVNPTYYFGPDSIRPFEADFAGPGSGSASRNCWQAIGEADLVLHGTDPLFDPPPPSLPRHHHHVGP